MHHKSCHPRANGGSAGDAIFAPEQSVIETRSIHFTKSVCCISAEACERRKSTATTPAAGRRLQAHARYFTFTFLRRNVGTSRS